MEAANDRISDLPESLLHHIHGSLDIKEGARTSVLSKKWNNIWRTVPTLHFSEPWQDDRPVPTADETEKFMNFVDGTLYGRNSSNVDKFILWWDAPMSDIRVHNWITSVIRANVKEIGLALIQEHGLFIPLSLFTCESLISLQVLTNPSIRLPKHIYLPRLKRLELYHFEFTNESWNEELFSSSHVLEELILHGCIYHVRNFSISIPTLKLLKIISWARDQNGLRDCVFEIDAPRLVTFSYSGYVAKEFVMSRFPALVEADVNLSSADNGSAGTTQLLRALAHVQCLTVYDNTILAMISSALTFQNVHTLKIADNTTVQLPGVISLLQSIPNLESLIFFQYIRGEIGEYGEANDDDSISDASESDINEGESSYNTECLFPHLKSVWFQEFIGNQNDLKLVKWILRYAEALEMMFIRYYDIAHTGLKNPKSEEDLKAEIPSFPRASAGCVIKFYS
ncbi:putative F-box/LRR-repeat protein At3g59230 [Papaver somniferum]|uniref:putative F-box/LRR-repeat protein At3g59230 n=1 Tax=Papaver somniferum TaxID=3469 RepID=UPI000E6F77D7|nr:putative F-box/LRR-repeat protein At3g59230 [Papaver somniferum]